MRLWEIVKMADEGSLKEGDKFIGVSIPLVNPLPIKLIIEYDGYGLIYNTIMSDTTSKDNVTLCGGEIRTEYAKL